MLKVVRHEDISQFFATVEDYLLQDEVTHNLLLGVTNRNLKAGKNMDFMLHVENASGELLAVAMRTAENTGAVISNLADDAALPVIVDAFAEHYSSLPTALGTPEDVSRFAQLWQAKTGQAYHIKMEQGIYRLDTLVPPKSVAGKARQGTMADHDLLVEWIQAFDVDTTLNEVTPEIARGIADRKLEGNFEDCVYFWEDAGKIVSMAGTGRQTKNGAGIGLVYTPSALRGKGYASAITAALSQAIFDTGKQFCFLYTDLSFPTSNKIYQAIGYQHVNNHRLIAFEN